ncbi:hypothetical protein [Ammoniphilus sp. 3BR4]|uniref:hypothetical protein n=1 Tax=Ammoniphilus sp. 3BR4 TaxID=3158265 RepID=UPI0034662218
MKKIFTICITLSILIITTISTWSSSKLVAKDDAIKVATDFLVHNYNVTQWKIRDVQLRYFGNSKEQWEEWHIVIESPTVIKEWDIEVKNHEINIDAESGKILYYNSDGFVPKLQSKKWWIFWW